VLAVAPSPAARADDPVKVLARCGTVTGPLWSHAGKSSTKYHVFATAKTSVIHAVCTLAKAAVPYMVRQTETAAIVLGKSKFKGHYGFNNCHALQALVKMGQKAFAGQCIDDANYELFAWLGAGLSYPGLGNG